MKNLTSLSIAVALAGLAFIVAAWVNPAAAEPEPQSPFVTQQIGWSFEFPEVCYTFYVDGSPRDYIVKPTVSYTGVSYLSALRRAMGDYDVIFSDFSVNNGNHEIPNQVEAKSLPDNFCAMPLLREQAFRNDGGTKPVVR